MKTMTFLVNPRGSRRRAPVRKRRTAARKRVVTPRKRRATTKRKPPKGFSTWTAYMASIRPTSGGTRKMAKRRRRKSTRKAVRRRNPAAHAKPVRHRRRYRRNPMGLNVRGIQNVVMGGVVDAAFGVAGKASVRIVRSKLGYDGATTIGAAVEVATATAIGIAAAKMLGPQKARAVVQGAFMSPIENFLKAANLPFVSSALGDEGDFAGVEDSMGGYVRDLAGYPAVTGGASVPRLNASSLGDEVGDEISIY